MGDSPCPCLRMDQDFSLLGTNCYEASQSETQGNVNYLGLNLKKKWESGGALSSRSL